MADLGAFLRAAVGDGRTANCSTLPADWCIALGHPDFAAAWRGVTFADDCDAIAMQAGGLFHLWRMGIGHALPVAAEAAAGDIGVLELRGFEAGGIFTGERWAMRRPRGLFFAAPSQVRAALIWRP